MMRRLAWLSLWLLGAWWVIPVVAPTAIHHISRSLGSPLTVASMRWRPWGVLLTDLRGSAGSAEVVELSLFWLGGPCLQIGLDRARLHLDQALSSHSSSLPPWLKVEVVLSHGSIKLQGSDLEWQVEGLLDQSGTQQSISLHCRAGHSHLDAHLERSIGRDWSGEIDAEQIPLPLLSQVARSILKPLLGELSLDTGVASGHLHVRDQIPRGDILLEYVTVREPNLGLELGLHEGLLSISGLEGVHLGVSENGWVRWGETGLEDLQGSIFWGNQLVMDLAGTVMGTGDKRVHVCCREIPDGWLAKLEMLKIPVTAAKAEISFHNQHRSQSTIRLSHFGAEEISWIGRLLAPWFELPNLSWRAKELDATATIDWEAGHPCRLCVENVRLGGLDIEAESFGDISVAEAKAEFKGGYSPDSWAGNIWLSGAQWTIPGLPAASQGDVDIRMHPDEGLEIAAQANIAGQKWDLTISPNAAVQFNGSIALHSLGVESAALSCLQWDPSDLFEIRGHIAECGLQLEGRLLGPSGTSFCLESSSGYDAIRQALRETSWRSIPWLCRLHRLPGQWRGETGSVQLLLEAECAWSGTELSVSSWGSEGFVSLGQHQWSIPANVQPILQFVGQPEASEDADCCALNWFNPSLWRGRAHVELPLNGSGSPCICDAGWDLHGGSLQVDVPWRDPAQLHLSWTADEPSINGKWRLGADGGEFVFGCDSEGPGRFFVKGGEDSGVVGLEHLDLHCVRFWPVQWDAGLKLQSQSLFSFLRAWAPEEGFLAALGAQIKTEWLNHAPAQISLRFAGDTESGSRLQVEGVDGSDALWRCSFSRSGGAWALDQGRIGDFDLARIFSSSNEGKRDQLVLSQGGQTVLTASFSDKHEILLKIEPSGLPLLCEELGRRTGAQESWMNRLQSHHPLAILVRKDQRGWVVNIPHFHGSLGDLPMLFEDVEIWAQEESLFSKGKFCNSGLALPYGLKWSQFESGTGEAILDLGHERLRTAWVSHPDRSLELLAIEGGILGQVGHLSLCAERPGCLSGSITLDLQALTPILPEDLRDAVQKLGLGKGIVFTGLLNLQEQAILEGKLLGNDFDALGATWEKCSADLYCSAHVFSLTDFSLVDPGGEVRAPRIEVRETTPRDWQLDIPLAGARNLVMNRLRWTGRHKRSVKYLVVEEVLFEGLQGPVDRPSAWRGKGHIAFENEAPRPAFLFIPAELLGNLGLDLSLLEPVRGRIHFALEDGFIRLKDLEDVVSIRNRSRFYLHPDPGFAVIGLDGTCNIRIWMKQFVVLKITQPLNLYITGNIRDPEISFQHSDKRCALSTSCEAGQS
jgi:hypothetical protein